MFSSCRRASNRLYVRVEQTALLYKEVCELPRRPWHHQAVDRPKLLYLYLGLGGTTRNLPVGECGVSR
ncbi:MAG: hypothetical protein QOH35_143 [Acidobacteriaceae bacterium]|jgi:hypothetical protein|nr:hypothetical protein [Acidobacteriaceae bacterium]